MKCRRSMMKVILNSFFPLTCSKENNYALKFLEASEIEIKDK
jgi:hypothetical protein